MIEPPGYILNHKLENGLKLSEFVGDCSPSCVPVHDVSSMSKIWRDRMILAKSLNHRDLELNAKQVIDFLNTCQGELSMLIWPKQKLAVLLSNDSEKYILVNDITKK